MGKEANPEPAITSVATRSTHTRTSSLLPPPCLPIVEPKPTLPPLSCFWGVSGHNEVSKECIGHLYSASCAECCWVAAAVLGTCFFRAFLDLEPQGLELGASAIGVYHIQVHPLLPSLPTSSTPLWVKCAGQHGT